MKVSLSIKLFLLLSLVFSQGLSVFASSSAMGKMQGFVDESTLAICTGKSVKWISADIYYETGLVVEVEPQAEIPSNLHDVSCVFAQLGDSPKTLAEFVVIELFSQQLLFKESETLVYFTARIHQFHFSSRAPPTHFV